MAIKISGKYQSSFYTEYHFPDGALVPVQNEAKNLDLTIPKYRSIFIFNHSDGIITLECQFLGAGFKMNNTFVLNQIVTEVVADVTWTVHSLLKPYNRLRVTRVATINGNVDRRKTEYLFSEVGLVVSLKRNDSDDVLVTYRYIRLPLPGGQSENVETTAEKH